MSNYENSSRWANVANDWGGFGSWLNWMCALIIAY